MRLVQAHAAHFVAVAVDHRDLVRLLQHLHQEIPEDVRHALRPALVAGGWIALPRQRDFAVLLHDFRRRGLEDRVGVIADQLAEVRHPVARARPVEHRAGTRQRRLKAGEKGMRPDAGEIRDRFAGSAHRELRERRTCSQCGATPPKETPRHHAYLPRLVSPVWFRLRASAGAYRTGVRGTNRDARGARSCEGVIAVERLAGIDIDEVSQISSATLPNSFQPCIQRLDGGVGSPPSR